MSVATARRRVLLANRAWAVRDYSLAVVLDSPVATLMLAALRIFGVLAYFASRRSHEIGVRLALRTQQRDILRFILGQETKLPCLACLLVLLPHCRSRD